MKKSLICFLFLVIMFSPFKVNALSCDYNERAKLRKIASNVTTSYIYHEINDTVTFDITITNLNSNIYIIDASTNKRYDYNGNSEITIKGYKPGVKIQFMIYTSLYDCIEDVLTTKYVNLPDYNKYYKDPLCEGHEILSICSKWQKVTYTHEEFIKKMNYYLRDTEEKKEEKIEEKTFIDSIFDFIFSYYYIIIPIIGLIIFGISYMRNRNDFDL